MLDCWRTGGANNPEVFVTAVAATLARYPDQVIYDVTDPTTGLPVQVTWMPSVKEVRDACEKAYRPIVENEARLKRIKEQMEMRERMDRGEKPTLAQLQERYGENWGLKREQAVKTLEEKAQENQAAMEREQARVKAEYAALGMPAPASKLALSPTTRRIIQQQDELRAALKQAAE